MAANREPCFAALFALIQGLTDWKLCTRVLQSWDDSGPESTPACFMAKGNEDAAVQNGLPPMWKLQARVVIYCRNDIENAEAGNAPAPSVQINTLLSALETALQRTPKEGPGVAARFPSSSAGGSWGTTLGGLCYSCQITGTVEVFEGLIDGGAVCIVPIEILTTG